MRPLTLTLFIAILTLFASCEKVSLEDVLSSEGIHSSATLHITTRAAEGSTLTYPLHVYAFNTTTHLTTSNTKSVITHDLTTKVGNTLDATLKFLLPANPQHFPLFVETLDADGNVLTSRTYNKDQANNDILYYLGRTTVIRTNLFTVGTTTTVTLEDWGEDNTYDID